MAIDLANIYNGSAGEVAVAATYARGEASTLVNAIFRELQEDDLITGEVYGDVMICEVMESEIDAAPFYRQPARLDTITRSLPAAGGGAVPRSETWEVATFSRTPVGAWKLVVQKNIRPVPK